MGKHDWLVRTLNDMAEYAQLNGLPLVRAAITLASEVTVAHITVQLVHTIKPSSALSATGRPGCAEEKRYPRVDPLLL